MITTFGLAVGVVVGCCLGFVLVAIDPPWLARLLADQPAEAPVEALS